MGIEGNDPGGRRGRGAAVPALIIGTTVIVAAAYVGLSLRRPSIETFEPTPPHESDPATGLAGPVTYTVDARDADAWRYFDFSRGSVVVPARPGDWDLAFRRFNIMANGGPGFDGAAGVVDLGEVAFDSVAEAPAMGYVETEAENDSVNGAIERWYRYGFTSHILRSKRHVYAVRTADGRFAKVEVISYYCPAALPGCITIRYVYQGSGERTFGPATGAAAGDAGAGDTVR